MVEHVLGVSCQLGEGPLWDWRSQVLHWVDIDQRHIHCFDPATGAHDQVDLPYAATAIALRASGGLLLATRHGFAAWDWDVRTLRALVDPEAGLPTRFNDGAVDSRGRFWAGTIALDPERYHLPDNRLYRLDPDGSVHLMESGLTISNGLGWSPDDRTMYLTDTVAQKIYAYDFDVERGTISNRRDFVSTPEEPGYPDGLTVDSAGGVWSARIAAGKIVRYTSDGRIEREITLPVSCPTSCTFGGPALDRLYITSSWHILSETEKASQPRAGDLFATSPGVTGRPAVLFAG